MTDAASNEHRKGEKYERLIARTKSIQPVPTIVVHPCDRSSLEGVIEATKAEIIEPLLVGPRARIEAAAAEKRAHWLTVLRRPTSWRRSLAAVRSAPVLDAVHLRSRSDAGRLLGAPVR